MTYDEWEEQFKPIENAHNLDAAFGGVMFETYGDEHAAVLTASRGAGLSKIWTLIEGDNDRFFIFEGYRSCNRVGYFITGKPAKTGKRYVVEA